MKVYVYDKNTKLLSYELELQEDPIKSEIMGSPQYVDPPENSTPITPPLEFMNNNYTLTFDENKNEWNYDKNYFNEFYIIIDENEKIIDSNFLNGSLNKLNLQENYKILFGEEAEEFNKKYSEKMQKISEEREKIENQNVLFDFKNTQFEIDDEMSNILSQYYNILDGKESINIPNIFGEEISFTKKELKDLLKEYFDTSIKTIYNLRQFDKTKDSNDIYDFLEN